MPKLTVMVSMYNSGDWIRNRLINLAACDMEDMEVWCVNANSPDERDHNIPQEFPFKYIKLPERLSVYQTWNYIIQSSDSEYITNANTDDIVAPHCYSTLIANLEHAKADFSYCSWHTTAKPNQQWHSMTDFCTDHPGQYTGNIATAGVGHFPLWRRSLHNKLGFFDHQFEALADADWWSRCYHLLSAKFCWTSVPLGLYLWRDGQNLWNTKINPGEWDLYHQKTAQYRSQGTKK